MLIKCDQHLTAKPRMHPKVSVIIPVYNREEYIAQTIKSVLSQTFQDFELLIVDDGSRDKTPAIIQKYAVQYPERIHCLEHSRRQNYGVSASRNLGIQHALGEYIAFLDSDDLWLPQKLEIQVDVLEKHPEVGLVYSAVAIIDEQGNPTTRMYGVQVWGEGLPSKSNNNFDLLFSRNLSLASGTSALVRKHILFEVGLFDVDLDYGEDELVACKIAYRYPMFFLPQPLAQYRIHGTNSSWNLKARYKGIRKIDYIIMSRTYKWLQTVANVERYYQFRIRLVHLTFEAYKTNHLSRWSLVKLFFTIFPFKSTDWKTLKIFISFVLGSHITLMLKKILAMRFVF